MADAPELRVETLLLPPRAQDDADSNDALWWPNVG